MRNIDELFDALGRSGFRSGFTLTNKEAQYLKEKGLAAVLDHARYFVTTRLGPAAPANDGRQTPMKNHPVFIAQHATATCCRRCLEKWHHIPEDAPLSEEQVNYVLAVIERWLKKFYI